MGVKTNEILVDKKEEDLYVTKITGDVEKAISASQFRSGIATVFVGCTTASISTMDYTPDNVRNMREALERVAPSEVDYEHHKTCADANGVGGDNNGKSHVRAAIMGPSITVPFSNGKLMLDGNMDVVLLDFDIIKRKRKVIVQLIGE